MTRLWAFLSSADKQIGLKCGWTSNKKWKPESECKCGIKEIFKVHEEQLESNVTNVNTEVIITEEISHSRCWSC